MEIEPGHLATSASLKPIRLEHSRVRILEPKILKTCEFILTQFSQCTFIIEKCQKNIYLKTPTNFTIYFYHRKMTEIIYIEKKPMKNSCFYVLHVMTGSDGGCLNMQRALRLMTHF